MLKSEAFVSFQVSSAVEHSDRRDAIRSTWGSKPFLEKYSSKIIFLLGQGSDRQSDVNDEAEAFGDVIQEDFHVIAVP